MLIVKKTRKFGRGVFASIDLKKGQIVEISPLIVLPKKDAKTLDKTLLGRYTYEFKDSVALALGLGSLFNHSDESNLDWKVIYKDQKILFWTNREIKAGEQLFIDYGYDPTVLL